MTKTKAKWIIAAIFVVLVVLFVLYFHYTPVLVLLQVIASFGLGVVSGVLISYLYRKYIKKSSEVKEPFSTNQGICIFRLRRSPSFFGGVSF